MLGFHGLHEMGEKNPQPRESTPNVRFCDANRRFKFQKRGQLFMLDRSLALRLKLGAWAASGEDSSMD